MHYRQMVLQPYRVAHFAHNPRATGQAERVCALALMTPEHVNAIETLLKYAPRVFDVTCGKPEHRFCDGKRRADVFFPAGDGRYAIAFEAQFSAIPFAQYGEKYTIEQRTADYHAAGAHVVWCLPAKRKHLIETIKRVYGCYGLLSDDGTEVVFFGTKAPSLNKHPQVWLAERTAWREAQIREREAQQAKELEELRLLMQRKHEEQQEAQREWREARIREQNGIPHPQHTAADIEAIAQIKRENAEMRICQENVRIFRESRRAIQELTIPEYTAPLMDHINPSTRDALRAWLSGGSAVLGMWVAKHTRDVEGRSHTTADYGRWVNQVKQLEHARPRITCLCCGRFQTQDTTRKVICTLCADDLVMARHFVADMMVRIEDRVEATMNAYTCAVDRLDQPRQQWWCLFQESLQSNPARANAAIAKAMAGDNDPFFAALRLWLIYQDAGDIYEKRQAWAREMKSIL
jgi:hypothetical protein